MKSPIQLFVALAVLLATATVAAQVYKWVDKDGKVQYSDTPPPPSASKEEGKRLNTGSAAPAAPAAATAAKSLLERAKESDKRRADDAEKAKKAEVADKIAKNNETRCKEATRYNSDLESGRPMVRNNDQGERTFMSEAERSAESAQMKSIIAEACGK